MILVVLALLVVAFVAMIAFVIIAARYGSRIQSTQPQYTVDDDAGEVIVLLEDMGFSLQEAAARVQRARSIAPNATLSELLRMCVRNEH